MAKARKKTAKKASKKTAKKTRKRRTPAQVAATKRLVAANKARAKGHKKTAKKTTHRRKSAKKTVRRRSQASWAKWAAKQQPTMTASGHMIYSGPMTRAQDTAARNAAKIMGGKKGRKRTIKYTGKYFKAPRGKVYGPTRADYVGPILPKSHTRKTRKKTAKVRTVTANQILGTAAKASKFHKLAAWVCANPSGRRTGCGGGKRGGHVVGILR